MQVPQQTRRAVLAAGVTGLAAGLIPARSASARDRGAESEPGGAASQRIVGKNRELPPALKVSVAGYSFRDFLDAPNKPGKMSLLDLVDMAAKWKIDAIEPTAYYFLKDDDAFVYALKRKAFLEGIEISGMPIGNNFCLPAGKDRDEQIAYTKKWVDIGAKLGAPAMRIFAGKAQKGGTPEADFKTMVPVIRECCDYAGAHGIFLAIEDHGYLTDSADAVLRILDAVKHDWLGVNLDTGNLTGDPYSQIAKLAPLAVTCQIKGVVHPVKGQQEPVDIPRVVQIMREAKYRGYLTLEFEEKDPMKRVPELLAQMLSASRA